jgi:hypothetical protein
MFPSSPTLRQRLDANAPLWFDLVLQMNQKLLASHVNGKPMDFGTLANGYTAVDLDTFAMDNSATKKELVGRTIENRLEYLRPMVKVTDSGSWYGLSVPQSHPLQRRTLCPTCVMVVIGVALAASFAL